MSTFLCASYHPLSPAFHAPLFQKGAIMNSSLYPYRHLSVGPGAKRYLYYFPLQLDLPASPLCVRHSVRHIDDFQPSCLIRVLLRAFLLGMITIRRGSRWTSLPWLWMAFPLEYPLTVSLGCVPCPFVMLEDRSDSISHV